LAEKFLEILPEIQKIRETHADDEDDDSFDIYKLAANATS